MSSPFDFREQQAVRPRPRRDSGAWVWLVGFLVVAGMVVGAFFLFRKPAGDPVPDVPVEKPVAIKFSQIEDDYEKNPLAAQRKWPGKWVLLDAKPYLIQSRGEVYMPVVDGTGTGDAACKLSQSAVDRLSAYEKVPAVRLRARFTGVRQKRIMSQHGEMILGLVFDDGEIVEVLKR
jgi:hypothetical protein